MYDYRELKKLGLSDKEAKIYLTSLQRGPETAPTLAKQAEIVRPTTYVVIDGLVKKGLMSSVTKGNKIYYTAESPEHLLSLLRIQKQELEEKEREFKRFLPELNSLANLSGEKPKVRVFEGKEGLKSIRELVFKTKVSEIYGFVPVDDLFALFSEKEHTEEISKRRAERKIKSQVFYTSNKKESLSDSDKDFLRDSKYVNNKVFPIKAGVDIYGDKVGIYTFKNEIFGILIENKDIAETMKSIFKMLWKNTKHKKVIE